MRHDLLRPITDEEVKRFREEGFVHLPRVLSVTWIARLRDLLNRELVRFDPREMGSADTSERAAEILRSGGKVLAQEGPRLGRSLAVRNVCRRNPDFLVFAVESPLPAIASALCGSEAIRFYNDQLFFKEPGSRIRTAFHSDADYFNVQGEQFVVLWVSVDPVRHSTGAMG